MNENYIRRYFKTRSPLANGTAFQSNNTEDFVIILLIWSLIWGPVRRLLMSNRKCSKLQTFTGRLVKADSLRIQIF